MAYRLSEKPRLNKDFSAIFGRSLGDLYDGEASAFITHRLSIDIVKLDEWLRTKHGYHPDDTVSTEQIVFKHYGDKGAALIDELI